MEASIIRAPLALALLFAGAARAQDVPAPTPSLPAPAAPAPLPLPAVQPAALPPAPRPSLWADLREGFESQLPVYCFFLWTLPREDSIVNPDEQLVDLEEGVFGLHLRPDLELTWRSLSLSARPRFTAEAAWADPLELDGVWSDDLEVLADDIDLAAPSRQEVAAYLHEWEVGVDLGGVVQASYGLDVLQWGPSILYSPTNPFFLDDGRTNPKLEVGALEFARLAVLPHPRWSIDLIANLRPGREPRYDTGLEDFSRTYAAVVGYTGDQVSTTFVGSYRETGVASAGMYGTALVNDALMLYADGVVRRGSDALYAREAYNLVGWDVIEAADDAFYYPDVLGGAAYTLGFGPTFALEYIYHGGGYGPDQGARYRELLGNVGGFVYREGVRVDYAEYIAAKSIYNRQRFLRRNYVSLQVQQNDLFDELSLLGRVVWSIDDSSLRFIPLVEWTFSDSGQLFLSGVVNAGAPDSDFGRLVSAQLMGGVIWYAW